MEARLRQLEGTEPLLFAQLVSQAVLTSSGGMDLPIPPDKLEELVLEIAPDLDPAIARQIGERISTRTLVYVTAEALL